MAAISNYLGNALLNESLRNTAFSQVAQPYLALYSVAPTAAGGGTELTGQTGYARQPVTFDAASGRLCNLASSGATFTAGSNWPTAVAFGIFDALTTGNLLYFSNLTASKTVLSGDSLVFGAADVQVGYDQ